MMSAKRIALYLRKIVLSVVIVFGAAAALIAIDGLNDELGTADVAIVLGTTVRPTGQPSASLRARLDKAVELYQRSLFTQVIVSGGVGREGFDEAAVMRNYLVARGLPHNRIWVDSAGNNTDLTAQNAAQLMQTHHWRSALVISQYFHIARCKLALQRHGVDQVFSAHATYFAIRDMYSIMREVVGYLVYAIRL